MTAPEEQEPGPWRMPSKFMAMWQAQRVPLPDGSTVPDFVSLEEAASMMGANLEDTARWAEEGLLEMLEVEGLRVISTVSVMDHLDDEGSRTPHERQIQLGEEQIALASRHPLGVLAGMKEILIPVHRFPGGVSDAEFMDALDGVGPLARAVRWEIERHLYVGAVPIGPDRHLLTDAEFDDLWPEVLRREQARRIRHDARPE